MRARRVPQPGDDPARGNRLKAFRKARGLTMKALAAQLGCDVSTVIKIEQGRQNPRKYRVKLCEVLGISDQMIDYGGAPNPALADFEAWLRNSPAAKGAPPWVIKWVRLVELPRPTFAGYRRLFYAAMAEDSPPEI